MNNPETSPNRLIVFYILGALLTLSAAVIATWSDLEAAFYGFDRRGSQPLQTLRCPVLLNSRETGVVSVKVSNTTERKLSPAIRAEFSTPATPLARLESVELGPGESKTVEWTIGPENIDLERFIFASVYVYAFYPLPDLEATCGTFVMDLPFPGSVLLYLMVFLGLAGMGGSWFMLKRSRVQSNRLEKALRPLTFLTIVLVLLLVVGLAGWWVQAVLLLTVAVIAIFVTLLYR